MRARGDLFVALLWSAWAGASIERVASGDHKAGGAAVLFGVVALLDARKVWRALGGRS